MASKINPKDQRISDLEYQNGVKDFQIKELKKLLEFARETIKRSGDNWVARKMLLQVLNPKASEILVAFCTETIKEMRYEN